MDSKSRLTIAGWKDSAIATMGGVWSNIKETN